MGQGESRVAQAFRWWTDSGGTKCRSYESSVGQQAVCCRLLPVAGEHLSGSAAPVCI